MSGDETLEALAKLLHEAGRDAVNRGAVVNKVPGQGFIEWPDLSEEAKEGRRIQARYLRNNAAIVAELL